MRHILLTLLLGLPFAVIAQEEEPTSQQAQGQQAQQTDEQQQAGEQAQQAQDQSGQGAELEENTFGNRSRTVSAESGGEIEAARAQFTSDVQEREPVDEVSDFNAGDQTLYFFTEIENAAGETVTHRWLKDGEVMAEVPLQVGSDSWRTWSSKELLPEWEGEWTVEVVDAQGNTIAEESVTVESSGAATQNVSHSPDEEAQTTPASTQGQQQQQGQATQTDTQSGDDGEGMQSDTLPEEIDYSPEEEQAEDAEEDTEDY